MLESTNNNQERECLYEEIYEGKSIAANENLEKVPLFADYILMYFLCIYQLLISLRL